MGPTRRMISKNEFRPRIMCEEFKTKVTHVNGTSTRKNLTQWIQEGQSVKWRPKKDKVTQKAIGPSRSKYKTQNRSKRSPHQNGG